MDQSKKVRNLHEGQVLYLGRWVDKKHFRTFVYDEKGNQKLVNSYQEYESLMAGGIWYPSKPDASQKRKQKDVIRADS